MANESVITNHQLGLIMGAVVRDERRLAGKRHVVSDHDPPTPLNVRQLFHAKTTANAHASAAKEGPIPPEAHALAESIANDDVQQIEQ